MTPENESTPESSGKTQAEKNEEMKKKALEVAKESFHRQIKYVLYGLGGIFILVGIGSGNPISFLFMTAGGILMMPPAYKRAVGFLTPVGCVALSIVFIAIGSAFFSPEETVEQKKTEIETQAKATNPAATLSSGQEIANGDEPLSKTEIVNKNKEKLKRVIDKYKIKVNDESFYGSPVNSIILGGLRGDIELQQHECCSKNDIEKGDAVDLEIIKEMKNSGIDFVNQLDGTSSLDSALGFDKAKIAEFLVLNGVGIETINHLKSPIMIFASDVGEAKWLLSKGVEIPKNILAYDFPANTLTAEKIELADFYIKNGADVNAHHIDTGGEEYPESVLWSACNRHMLNKRENLSESIRRNFHEHLNYCMLLLENGAEFSEDSESPVCRALESPSIGDLEAVSLFASKGLFPKKCNGFSDELTILQMLSVGMSSADKEEELEMFSKLRPLIINPELAKSEADKTVKKYQAIHEKNLSDEINNKSVFRRFDLLKQ